VILIYIRKGVHDDVELMIHMISPDDVEGFEMHGFSKGKGVQRWMEKKRIHHLE